MIDTRIILSAIWVAVALIYLEGDVFRMFSGDFIPGKSKMIPEAKTSTKTQLMWVGLSAFMSIPIIMVIATLTLDPQMSRIANIGLAGFFALFNLVGLPTYPGWYDRFMLVISIGFNLLTIWYAWNWI
jgi:hypothetical protein